MIKVICVGKLKEKYWKDAVIEYSKRISKYSKIEVIEVNDYNSADINTILLQEKNDIIKYIGDRDCVIPMEIEGKQLDSVELAKKIDSLYLNYSNITFIIGGSYGLHEDIKKRSNYALSFSKMTFPHQMFRIMLLEQIYRSYKILNNESYHK